MTKGKYKATPAFDVDAFDNYKGLGNENHAKLTKGETVELEVSGVLDQSFTPIKSVRTSRF